ncbi:MAG: LLM class flavin-dependent oxidoreductase [Thaumarchaeota archaeon]|nr:LLM class flavin-dependent oxidoreductase [Nitrososphaerota archaeon]MCY3975622.1 LLM class flavin-dependent oxidoreductase [Nitrososphaerota archaeon]
MKISYNLGSLLTINQILDCIRIIKKNRISNMVWIPETWGMETFSMLGAISSMIPNVEIGTSIINVYSRSPSLIAMAAATLDTLSNGKFVLGLGVSTDQIIKNFHGYKYESQLLRIQEYVEIIRLTLTQNKVFYNGKLFKLKNFTLLIRPKRTKIPIYLAAVNKNMIKLAEQIADGVIFYLRPIENMKNIIRKTRSKQFKYNCQFITCMSYDVDDAICRVQKTLAFYISVSKLYRNFLAQCGFNNEVNNIYNEFLSTGFKYNHKLISKRMLDSLTIYGSPEDCIKQLLKIKKTGLDLAILQFNPYDQNEVNKSFNLLVDKISSI